MSITADVKNDLIGKYKISDSDTGSVEIQVAILTERIKNLTGHFKTHKKDHHSRRGLIKLVNKRRRHLKYLKTHRLPVYQKLIQDLGIRG